MQSHVTPIKPSSVQYKIDTTPRSMIAEVNDLLGSFGSNVEESTTHHKRNSSMPVDVGFESHKKTVHDFYEGLIT